ncbi:MAG: PilZ domain-containing protein [Deltaproteobacteria bacterium]|nr:PilZ domain-containing protein [Deltaproteobacteria bacterium]
MDAAADNRRRFARLDLALSVSYRLLDGGTIIHDPREALSSDISVGGLRLMTPTELPTGSAVELLVTLEGSADKPVVATGEVVWQHRLNATSYETGVIITEMPDADRSRFMQFVFDQMSKIVTPLGSSGTIK